MTRSQEGTKSLVVAGANPHLAMLEGPVSVGAGAGHVTG